MLRGLLLVLVLCSAPAFADDESGEYDKGEEVTVWSNKIGPYHNPQETYDYEALPFCKPAHKKIKHKSSSLGEYLEGSDLVDTGLHIKFGVPETNKKVCDLTLTGEAVELFTHAVKNHYWYQLYIDELPIWGMVGEYMVAEGASEGASEQQQGFLYTHQDYSIGYNGNQVIEVNLTLDGPKPISIGANLEFTYSVTWKETTTAFEARYDRYHDFDFFEHQIHWFSIFNSFMMVVFLCGLVALILMRTLKNDYARFTSEDEDLEVDRVIDESGWKQVHGHVFRAPSLLSFYSALIATGYQLFFMVFCVIFLIIVGEFYHERGTIVTTLLVCYSLTSFAAGFKGASFYKRHNGVDWKQTMAMTAAFLPGVCMSILTFLNFIAYGYGSNQFIGFTTVIMVACIWAFVSVPLILLGTITGRSMATVGDYPCRVNALTRPIPDGKWYTKPSFIALLAGVLPFGSIFIELYFIFTSFWNYKFYYVYGFMLLVYCILIIVTSCVTIVSTYFLLSSEDYRWHWTSFASGASTALYVFLYSVYYFFAKTHMHGLLQTMYYFSYMIMFSLSLAVLTGTIGFMGTNIFIRHIYQNIKSD